MWSETTVTCASRPLVTPDMRSIVGVDLAMFRGADIQATVPLDGDLQGWDEGKPCGWCHKNAINIQQKHANFLIQNNKNAQNNNSVFLLF